MHLWRHFTKFKETTLPPQLLLPPYIIYTCWPATTCHDFHGHSYVIINVLLKLWSKHSTGQWIFMLPSTAMSWDPCTVQDPQSLPYPLARHQSVGVEQGPVLSTKPQDELAGTGRLDCFQSLKKANSPAQFSHARCVEPLRTWECKDNPSLSWEPGSLPPHTPSNARYSQAGWFYQTILFIFLN